MKQTNKDRQVPGILAGLFKLSCFGFLLLAGSANAVVLERISVSSSGTEGNGSSGWPSMSADGRYVAFASAASNLVAGDTNDKLDVFVRDRQTNTIERISQSASGQQGDGHSTSPRITPDGRYVVFESDADNLVPGDIAKGIREIFVVDRETHAIELVSKNALGVVANSDAYLGSISADGQKIAYSSTSTNLVAEDIAGVSHVYVYQRDTGNVLLASRASDGSLADGSSYQPIISDDGSRIVFTSTATNLGDDLSSAYDKVVERDLATGQTRVVSGDMESAVGRYMQYGISPLSADGRYLVFNAFDECTFSTCEVYIVNFEVILADLTEGTFEVISKKLDGMPVGGGDASISSDGRYVAYCSYESGIVEGDTNGNVDVFVYDRKSQLTERVNTSIEGQQSVGNRVELETCWGLVAQSGNGRYVAFYSDASDLVPDDNNQAQDIFLAQVGLGTIEFNLEEPIANQVLSGVGSVRGWAVSPVGIDRVELYVDGMQKGNVPWGGTRRDVAGTYPDYPNADQAGFSTSFGYFHLEDGEHVFKIRAVDKDGIAVEKSVPVNTQNFQTTYIAVPSLVDGNQAQIEVQDNRILIHGLQVDGKDFDVIMGFSKQTQGMVFEGITPAP